MRAAWALLGLGFLLLGLLAWWALPRVPRAQAPAPAEVSVRDMVARP